MSKEAAAKAVSIILASYPSVNKENLEGFYRMSVEALKYFPDEILQALCNLTMGIQTKNKFVPSIAEMKEFCNKEWDRLSPRVVIDRAEEVKQLYGRVEPNEAETAEDAEKRQKVIDGFASLVSELKRTPGQINGHPASIVSIPEEKAAAELWLANMAARAAVEPPPMLPDEVLRKFH